MFIKTDSNDDTRVTLMNWQEDNSLKIKRLQLRSKRPKLIEDKWNKGYLQVIEFLG